MSLNKSSDGAPVGFEVRFLTTDRQSPLTELRSGTPAVQEAVVINDDARDYEYHLATSSTHPGLSYPERSPEHEAKFTGVAKFNRRGNWRSEPLYEAVVYTNGTRTQPEQVEIAKSLVVGNVGGSPGRWVPLAPHYVTCTP